MPAKSSVQLSKSTLHQQDGRYFIDFFRWEGGEEGGTGNIRGRQAGRVWDKGSRSTHSLSHPDSPFPTNTADVTSRENVLFLFEIYDFHLKKRQFVFFF